MSDSLQPHGLQHARPPCPSPTPGACSDSCLLSEWCHPTISSSLSPFSSHLQSFPTSRSFLVSQFFASDGQSIRVSVSASVLPMNIYWELKIYRAWPHPSEQDPVPPSASLSHQEASTSLLSSSIQGWTEWKPQSQKTNQTDHMDHSLV